MDQIQVFNYNGQTIEFDLSQKNLMVNATEMGRIYDKLPKDFLKTENTQAFIAECLKKDNYPYLGIESETDLINSKQNKGTWMHRILALKFAAWLDPTFELWVYITIDKLLFGAYRELEESIKASATRLNRMEQLRAELLEVDAFRELEQLQLEQRHASYRRAVRNKNQLDLFRSMN